MIIDPNLTISDRAKVQVVTLRAALTHLLDNMAAVTRDDARCNGRLSDRIMDAGFTIDLSTDDLARIRKAIDADKGMKSWAVEALEFLLWPSDLANSDLERMRARYGLPNSEPKPQVTS